MSVYHFWSTKCGPCMKLKPVIADLKEEFSTLTWTSINILNDPEGITQKYGITKIPAIVVVSAKGIDRHAGMDAAGYYRILKHAS